MTKKEIYEQVVRLTTELTRTNIAEKIFSAVANGEAVRVDMIIDSFPDYYPELYQRIISFGNEFNQLVGDSAEDNAKIEEMEKQCKYLMNSLAASKVIGQIAEAVEAGNATRLLEVITNFKQERPPLAEDLVQFQKEYSESRDDRRTGHEGEIFGIEADEENNVFTFDTNVIDALSFYLLVILADISDVYFFCDGKDVGEDGNDFPSNYNFIDAIEKATNEAFAEFVSSYNIADWIRYEDEEFQTAGEILVAAFAGEIE